MFRPLGPGLPPLFKTEESVTTIFLGQKSVFVKKNLFLTNQKFLSKNFFDQNLIRFENEVLRSNLKSITNERQGKKSTIKKAETNLKNLNKRLKIVKEQEEISEKLLKAEATNRLRHLELLRELSDVEAKIDEQKSIIYLSKKEYEKQV